MKVLLRILLVWIYTLVNVQVSAQTKIDSNDVEEIVAFTTRGINASGARYHLDGCRYLKNGQIHIDERKALQRGLLPCSICLPERTEVLPQLREKKAVQKKVVFRKCSFKTASGAKCEREAITDSRYCELHKTRTKKKKR
jgi:hypothetical protein